MTPPDSSPVPDTGHRIGIDLGGTKIEIMVLDPTGAPCLTRRVPTPRGSLKDTVTTIKELVEAVERELAITAPVGVGMPGAVSPATGLIKNANSTWLNGTPFHTLLGEALAREVRVANDADCFALSEAVDGAAAGARTVFGIIIGTGTGAGIIFNGQIVTGPNATGGEWGHIPLPWPRDEERPGPACYCGRHGCIETWLSGPGFQADHERATGERLSATEIVARAETGDRACAASFELYCDRMARATGQMITVLDPDVIVLGGGLSRITRLYTEIPPRWERHVFSDTVETRLVPPKHGDSSGVRGAARLWP